MTCFLATFREAAINRAKGRCLKVKHVVPPSLTAAVMPTVATLFKERTERKNAQRAVSVFFGMVPPSLQHALKWSVKSAVFIGTF